MRCLAPKVMSSKQDVPKLKVNILKDLPGMLFSLLPLYQIFALVSNLKAGSDLPVLKEAKKMKFLLLDSRMLTDRLRLECWALSDIESALKKQQLLRSAMPCIAAVSVGLVTAIVFLNCKEAGWLKFKALQGRIQPKLFDFLYISAVSGIVSNIRCDANYDDADSSRVTSMPWIKCHGAEYSGLKLSSTVFVFVYIVMALVNTVGTRWLFKCLTKSLRETRSTVLWTWQVCQQECEVIGYPSIHFASKEENCIGEREADEANYDSDMAQAAETEDIAIRAAVAAHATDACSALATQGCRDAISRIHIEYTEDDRHQRAAMPGPKRGCYRIRVALPDSVRGNIIAQRSLEGRLADQLSVQEQVCLQQARGHGKMQFLGNHEALQKYAGRWVHFGILQKLFTAVLAYISTVQDATVQASIGLAFSAVMVLAVTTKPFLSDQANKLNLIVYLLIASIFSKAFFLTMEHNEKLELNRYVAILLLALPACYKLYNLIRAHIERFRQHDTEANLAYFIRLVDFMDVPEEMRQVYKTTGNVEAVPYRAQNMSELRWKLEEGEQHPLSFPGFLPVAGYVATGQPHLQVQRQLCHVGHSLTRVAPHSNILK